MRMGGGFERFLSDRRSTTAVELAVIAPVLFLFLLGILLMGVGQFWQLVLDDAVRNATRQVEIGNVGTGSAFVTSVCNEFGLTISGCASTLQYSVQGAATFSAITPATVNSAGALSNPATFNGIAVNNPLLVQVAFVVPVSLLLIPESLITMNGTQSIISAVAGVNEP
jgi:Flp pilus assembly protein TadG